MALGDLFNNGQYTILRKLGEGSYSTVWLAQDVRYVPLYEDTKKLLPSLCVLNILKAGKICCSEDSCL